MNNNDKFMIGCALCIILLIVTFIWNLFLTWIATLVASGFGYNLPFWPTFGLLYLFQAIISGISVKFNKG